MPKTNSVQDWYVARARQAESIRSLAKTLGISHSALLRRLANPRSIRVEHAYALAYVIEQGFFREKE